MSLENFIKENKDRFDVSNLPENDTGHFEKKLNNKFHRRQISKVLYLNPLLRIAASFLLLLGAYLFGKYENDSEMKNQMLAFEQENIEMKKIAATTLIDSDSPVKRIEGIGYTDDLNHIDEAILDALIDKMLNDENINVRYNALQGLIKYAFRDDVKEVLLRVLKNERDPKILVPIIKTLVSVQDTRVLDPTRKILEREDIDQPIRDYIIELLPSTI